jgi:hypothetical protein
VTGEFHNLTSSGTFPLPGNDTRSSGSNGAVQLSDGNGGFINDGQLYVQNGLVLDNSMITDNTQKPFVLALTSTGQTGYVPNPSVDKDGDIFFGAVQNSTTSFYGYKTGGWVDLAGAGGGGSGSSAPLNSIQFAGAQSVFQSSPLYGFYKGGQNLPSGPPLGPDQNALIIGSTAGQGSALPNATTQINYVSDSTEQVQFLLSKSGLQIELPNSGNNQEFFLETKEIGVTPNPPVVIQTRDGDINLQSIRSQNTTGEGSINILTNKGGINLETRGENTAQALNGGNITLDSQDGNIFLTSTKPTSTNLTQIKLNSVGGYGNTFTNESILLETTNLSTNPSSFSGNIVAKTEGGRINLKTTTGTSSGDGGVFLSTEEGNISINAGGVASVPNSLNGKILNLSAVNGVKANTKFSVTTGAGVPTWIDNITLDGPNGVLSVGDASGSIGDIQVKNSANDICVNVTANADGGDIQVKNTSANNVVRLNTDATQNGIVNVNNSSAGNGIKMTADGDGGEITVNSLSNNNPAIFLDSNFSTGINYDNQGTQIVLFQGTPQARLGHIATGANSSGIGGVIRSGLAILPKSGGVSTTPIYSNDPLPDSNLLLGQYGWGTTSVGAQPTNVNVSRKNEVNFAAGQGGSGNVYCDNIRQNTYYWMPTAANAPGTSTNPNSRSWGGTSLSMGLGQASLPNYLWPTNQGSHSWGYQDNSAAPTIGRGWYNDGNIRHLLIDVGGSVTGSQGANFDGAGVNGFWTEVRLPQINEAMVGMKVTVTRLRVPPHNPNGGVGVYTTTGQNFNAGIEFHKIAVVIKSSGNQGANTDLINAPDSIVVYPSGAPGDPYVALDPYRVLIPFANGVGPASSGLVGNEQINKWTFDFSGTTINTKEGTGTTTAAVPGVTISQQSGAGNIRYGTLVEINFTNAAQTAGTIVFTSPAPSSGLAGVYNFVDTLSLYIGGRYGLAAPPTGSQSIAAVDLTFSSRVNLGNPSTTPATHGFPTPYTSISSATFVATAIGNGMTTAGFVASTKYIWNYINEYPSR